MIIQETVKIGDRVFTKTYSDKYLYIERDGIQYSEAMDVKPHEYTETSTRLFSDEDLEHLPQEMREKVLEAYQ